MKTSYFWYHYRRWVGITGLICLLISGVGYLVTKEVAGFFIWEGYFVIIAILLFFSTDEAPQPPD